MDKRGREADKRYRENADKVKFVTISLTINQELLLFLEEKVKEEADKNMSRFIEDIVISELPNYTEKKVPKRRKFKTYPLRKTFTFSEDFVEKVRKSGNMSVFIETILSEKFGLE